MSGFKFLLLFLCFQVNVIHYKAEAQCVTVYPYLEDFETTDGNWVAGGTNSDWTWGQPTKTLITQAGSGNNCWITGGLNFSGYNGGQKSWIESPCFDFSSLTSPSIRFLIFWDTERTYDGGNLQYTTNGGINWINLGSINDVSCQDGNWFNTSPINNLSGIASPRDGWSGNINTVPGSCLIGGGLGTWVTASHCMQFLAGNPNVKFRYTFCSGTTCNSYDGIAIDSVYIGETPPASCDFTPVCVNDKEVSLTAVVSGCASSYNWDFGDISGIGTHQTENHTYSDFGNYTITLTTNFECLPSIQVQKNISIMDASVATYPVTCKDGMDGAAAILVQGSANPIITWNTNPQQIADSIYNLNTGNFSVTVTEPGACPLTKQFSIGYGAYAFPLADLGPDMRLCPGDIYTLDPGKFKDYLWNDGSDLPQLIVSTPGIYSVIVANDSGCAAVDSILIKEGCGNNVWVPQSFTPNADGKNEIFMAKGIAIESFRMDVFNRFGQPVFESDDITQGWDGTFNGTESTEGVYGYALRYKLFDGKTYTKAGTVTLLR